MSMRLTEIYSQVEIFFGTVSLLKSSKVPSNGISSTPCHCQVQQMLLSNQSQMTHILGQSYVVFLFILIGCQ